MEFNDSDLIAILTAQRNAVTSDSAQLQAIIRKLQQTIAEKDALIAELEKPKKRGK